MRWQAIALAALVLTTGCIGMGGDGTDDSDQDLDAQNTPDEQVNETDTEEPTNTTEWTSETYEGSVTGTSTPAGSLTIVPLSENSNVQFTAQQGIDELVLNLTSEGGELQMRVGGPNCDGSACEEVVETSGGEAQYTNDTAEPGEWTVRLFPADAVANSVSYELEVAQQLVVPADA